MKPDDSTKNGLAAMPATAKLLRAFPKEVEMVTCERCGERTPPLRSGLCLSCGRPRAGAAEGEVEEKKSDVARGDDCCGTVAPLTLRERVARFIFPRRTIGEFPAAALSSAVDWTKGDVLTTTAWVDLSFLDLLRLLCSRRLLCEVKTACEGKPGRTASLSAISVLPPQFLEPGPSGNWSPEDERDLFDTLAGMKTEIVETGYAGAPANRSLLCLHCGHFGEVDHECSQETCRNCGLEILPTVHLPPDGKMSPLELRAVRDQYRILEPGETIQDGDEWRPSENADWILCAGGAGCRVSGGLFRRPVQGGIGLFEAAQNARHLAPMGAVWKPTPPNTACAACGELIVNEACRCGIRGPNGPGPHPDGAPGTDMRELEPGEIIETGDRLGNGELVDLWSIGKPAGTVKLPIFRGVPLGEQAGVEGEEGRPE